MFFIFVRDKLIYVSFNKNLNNIKSTLLINKVLLYINEEGYSSKLYFYYSKEERILQTSVKIKVKSNVGMIHMPEIVAILTIILK